MLQVYYQLAFLTPGISPRLANSRKQIRQMPNCLIYPLFLPHLKQRLTMRVENFGFFLALAITDVLAIIYILRLNGTPIFLYSSNASFFFLIIGTAVISNPKLTLEISGLTSGKTK